MDYTETGTKYQPDLNSFQGCCSWLLFASWITSEPIHADKQSRAPPAHPSTPEVRNIKLPVPAFLEIDGN